MENLLKTNRLFIALSYIFVDTAIDYNYIASVAKKYPEWYVKHVFFNYVAPACYYNILSPVPPICYFFDEELLVSDINKIRKKKKTLLGKLKMCLFCFYLKVEFKNEWLTLRSFL